MTKIYRVRKANEQTIDELSQPYLWFSRPSGFNDTDDANILSFINDNESISEAFTRIFSDKVAFAKEFEQAGICCFSKGLTTSVGMRFYPGAGKGIVIEYDKIVLEEYFTKKFGLGDCFKNIEYTDHPTVFESSSGYDILWKKIGKLKLHKSVIGMMRDPKERDSFFLRMLTRLAKKFRGQREARIILAGRNIPSGSAGAEGFKVPIPKEAIRCIHAHMKCSADFIKELQDLGFKVLGMNK